MLDLSQYQSIGAALKDAMTTFSAETCLIEADRDREKERLAYKDFQSRACPLARALQDMGFAAADRAAGSAIEAKLSGVARLSDGSETASVVGAPASRATSATRILIRISSPHHSIASIAGGGQSSLWSRAYLR